MLLLSLVYYHTQTTITGRVTNWWVGAAKRDNPKYEECVRNRDEQGWSEELECPFIDSSTVSCSCGWWEEDELSCAEVFIMVDFTISKPYTMEDDDDYDYDYDDYNYEEDSNSNSITKIKIPANYIASLHEALGYVTKTFPIGTCYTTHYSRNHLGKVKLWGHNFIIFEKIMILILSILVVYSGFRHIKQHLYLKRKWLAYAPKPGHLCV